MGFQTLTEPVAEAQDGARRGVLRPVSLIIADTSARNGKSSFPGQDQFIYQG
jgi:hypothetical protein